MSAWDIIVIFLGLFYLYMVLDHKNLARRRAGRDGEYLADKRIKSILKKGDYLLSNVNLNEEGRKTELDKVVINKNGLFVFEVKSFSGTVYGEETDENWEKIKVSRGGKRYTKIISNPIIQLKREINILANLLKKNNVRVWVNGYVYLFANGSHVTSELVVMNSSTIDSIIHAQNGTELSEEKIKQIIEVLNTQNKIRTLKKVKVYKK